MLRVVSDSDADLLGRIGERDLAAFEILYARYVRAVYAMAKRSLRDGGHAEDATQEVFAAVWRSATDQHTDGGVGEEQRADDVDAVEEVEPEVHMNRTSRGDERRREDAQAAVRITRARGAAQRSRDRGRQRGPCLWACDGDRRELRPPSSWRGCAGSAPGRA
jgi:hypothetical protein